MARTARRSEPVDEAQTIHDELVAAAMETNNKFGVQHPNEEDQAYLRRLVVGLADAPDDIWNNLSRDAQEWFNDATEAMNEHKPVEEPDGFEATEKKPARQARGAEAVAERTSRRRAAEPAAEEETTSRRGRRAAEPAEEETTSRRGRRAAAEADDEPLPPGSPGRGRRAASTANDDDGEVQEATTRRPGRRAAADADAAEEATTGRGRRGTTPPAEEATSRRRASNGDAAPARRARGETSTREPGAGQVNSVSTHIRRLIVSRPTMSNEQLTAALEKKGLTAKEVSINATRLATLATIAEVKRAGKWAE